MSNLLVLLTGELEILIVWSHISLDKGLLNDSSKITSPLHVFIPLCLVTELLQGSELIISLPDFSSNVLFSKVKKKKNYTCTLKHNNNENNNSHTWNSNKNTQ